MPRDTVAKSGGAESRENRPGTQKWDPRRGNSEVLLTRAHYVATATVGITQRTGEKIEIFF